jgi:AcrR family transcriptional regulator
MSRPRSDAKRTAILEAATRVISTQGLAAAATSAIAKEAGVSNGSLFVYFGTKTALLNELYVLLKTEMGDAAFASLPTSDPLRDQVGQMWSQWLSWAVINPEKRRALAQLEVAEDITADSHRAVQSAQRDMAELVERARSGGPMAAVPISFVMALTSSIADGTMDALIRDPAAPDARSAAAFDAVWRVLAG